MEREIAARQKDDGISFQVCRDDIERRGSWTYITVFPKPSDRRVFRYSEKLSEIEDAIKKQTKIKLLLVPMTPTNQTDKVDKTNRTHKTINGYDDKALLDLVEKEIAAHDKKDGNAYHVSKGKIRREGRWAFIVVYPEPEDMRAYDYAEFMGEVEEAVEKQTDIKLLLVPAMPD